MKASGSYKRQVTSPFDTAPCSRRHASIFRNNVVRFSVLAGICHWVNIILCVYVYVCVCVCVKLLCTCSKPKRSLPVAALHGIVEGHLLGELIYLSSSADSSGPLCSMTIYLTIVHCVLILCIPFCGAPGKPMYFSPTLCSSVDSISVCLLYLPKQGYVG